MATTLVVPILLIPLHAISSPHPIVTLRSAITLWEDIRTHYLGSHSEHPRPYPKVCDGNLTLAWKISKPSTTRSDTQRGHRFLQDSWPALPVQGPVNLVTVSRFLTRKQRALASKSRYRGSHPQIIGLGHDRRCSQTAAIDGISGSPSGRENPPVPLP